MQTYLLGLLTPLMGFGFAVTFYVMWRVGRLGRHVLGFAISYVIVCCAYLSTHLLPSEAPYIFHLTQALYTAGIILFIGSVCDRVGLRIPLISYVVIYLFSAAALAAAVYFSSDVGPRLIIVNTGYGVMFVMAIATLLTARRRTAIDTGIILVMAFQAADFLIRPNMTLLYESAIPAAVYRESMYYSVIGLVLGIKSVTTAMMLVVATVAEWTSNVRESGLKDPLTGLRNRGAFEQSMRELMPRAQTEGLPLSLVVADIDHFKQVNDIWGHQAGDRAIADFGGLIEQTVRECDTAGRIGGEEFCIAVWNCASDPAERLAERIRKALAHKPQEGLGKDIRLTASFGVATARPGETYEQLFARADGALYEAKKLGRDRVQNAERDISDEPDQALSSEFVESKQAAG